MSNVLNNFAKYLFVSLVLITSGNHLCATTTMVAPQVVVDGSGNATAIWLNVTDTQVDVNSAYKPVGFGWGTEVTLSSVSAPFFSNAQIQIDTLGNVVVGWIGIDSTYEVFSIFSNTWDATNLVWIGAEQVSEVGVGVEGNFTIGISGGDAQAVWSSFSGSDLLLFTNTAALGSWGGSPVTLP